MKVLLAGALVLGFVSVPGGALARPVKLLPREVVASSTYRGSSPANAVDGIGSTAWTSEANGTQWIQLDFGRPVAIRTIRLQQARSLSRHPAHEISAGLDVDNLTKKVKLESRTSDRRWLVAQDGGKDLGNVRYLRITTTNSPSRVAWREIEVEQGVEYVGYFGDAVTWVDDNSIAATTAQGANLVWIGGGPQDTALWIPRLNEASAAGAQAMLVLTSQLFNGDSTLRADWDASWTECVAILRTAPSNSVAAFYLTDEPYAISAGPMHKFKPEVLAQVAARMRKDFPSTPIAVILGPEEMQRQVGRSHVSMFDWVGFDCYGPWDNCNFVGSPTRWYIDTLKSWLLPGQRMIAVPGTYRWGSASLDQVTSVISQWHREVISDASYVAVTPFRWGTARDLPQVKDRMHQFTRGLLRSEKTVYPVDFSASASPAGAAPFFAFNRDDLDQWSSAGRAPAWIEADLGGSTRVTGVSLRVAQLPMGKSTHVLEGLAAGNQWIALATFAGTTEEGQWLSWSGVTNISKLRVTTPASVSWVAWHEIQITSDAPVR